MYKITKKKTKTIPGMGKETGFKQFLLVESPLNIKSTLACNSVYDLKLTATD